MRTLFQQQIATVYEALKPVFLISKFAGICTVKYDKTKNGLVTSHFMVILQIVLLIVGILHLILIPYSVMYKEKRMSLEERLSTRLSNISEVDVPISQHFITKMANPILISVTALIVRILDISQVRKFLPHLISTINTIDRLTVTRRPADSKWLLAFTVFLILISWPFQLYSNFSSEKTIVFMLVLLLNVFNNFSTACCELQFISLCWVFRSRFNCVNEELRQLNLTNEVVDDGLCKRIERFKQKPISNEKITARLARIRKSHRLLCESCSQLNTLYNFQVFASLGSCAINVLLNLYFAIFGGFRRPATTEYVSQPFSDIIQAVVWSLYYFGRFAFLCTSTGHLTKAVDTYHERHQNMILANATKSIICYLMDAYMDKATKQELWMFFAYTMANKVQFTACGFFKIDITLITAAVTTGTTYLVILAQFHKH